MDFGVFLFWMSIPVIVGLIETIIAIVWFRTISASLWIMAGSIIGCWITLYAVGSSEWIDRMLLPLWKWITGIESSDAVLGLFIVNRLLLQFVGSLLGGALGLRVWLSFFRI